MTSKRIYLKAYTQKLDPLNGYVALIQQGDMFMVADLATNRREVTGYVKVGDNFCKALLTYNDYRTARGAVGQSILVNRRRMVRIKRTIPEIMSTETEASEDDLIAVV